MTYIYPKNGDGSTRGVSVCTACGHNIISRAPEKYHPVYDVAGTAIYNIGANCYRKIFFSENQTYTFKNGKTLSINRGGVRDDYI